MLVSIDKNNGGKSNNLNEETKLIFTSSKINISVSMIYEKLIIDR